MKSREFCHRGFSLVEVVLAIGVFSFALVVVFALLPIGMNLNRESQDESFAVNALATVLNARRSVSAELGVPAFNLPPLTNGMTAALTNVVYLNEDYASTNQTAALYKVTVVYLPPPAGSATPFLLHGQASWPAGGAQPRGQVETVAAISRIPSVR